VMFKDDSCHCHREKTTLNFTSNIQKNQIKMFNTLFEKFNKDANHNWKADFWRNEILPLFPCFCQFHSDINFICQCNKNYANFGMLYPIEMLFGKLCGYFLCWGTKIEN
jgi:hypothetical protein